MAGFSIFACTRLLNNLYSPYKPTAYPACSSSSRRAFAPAKVQRCACSLASWSTIETGGVTPSNTHRFLCFHRVHARRITRELSPFAPPLEPFVSPCATIFGRSHPVDLVPLLAGRTNRREKTQVERRCSMSSSSWSDSGQRGWCGNPRRASLSAI
jgi:hypothetical protein